MGKPPIIGIVMGVAGVGVVVFLTLLFLSDPGRKPRPPTPATGSLASEQAPGPEPGPPAEPPAQVNPKPPRPPIRKNPPGLATPTDRPEPPPLQAVFTVRDTQPPRLRVITPKSPVYVMTNSVTIRARSEAGAHLKVEGHPFLETAIGVYVAKLNLLPGLNQLTVTARDAVGNTSKASLMVTYIDPSRINQVKDNLISMLKQLEEIKQSVDQVDARTEEIINAIADTDDADKVNELSRNLREIRRAKRTLQKEIEKAFSEINAMLAKR